MATKQNKLSEIDSDMEAALEDAFDLDIDDDLGSEAAEAVAGSLDDELSLDDFEAQVSQATDDLRSEATGDAFDDDLENFMPPEGADDDTSSGASTVATAAVAGTAAAAATVAATTKPARSPAPANDDSVAKDYNQTIDRLNAPVPGSPLLTASILSIVWILGAVGLAHVLYAPDVWEIRTLDALRANPGVIAIAVGTIIPVFLFFAFAIMSRRAAEMRQTAKSMSEIAYRLAAPEKLAEQQVTTVGQAVRREVAAMSEGIERTIARATELEAMMQSEVGELERVYTDNEVRVRSLLTDLGNEREGIVTHAERLRASISGAHEQLRDELGAVSTNIRENVLSASTEMTMALSQSGETAVSRLVDTGGQINQAVAAKLDELSGKLSDTSGDIGRLLDTRIATLTERTNQSTAQIASTLETNAEALLSRMNETSGTMVTTLDGKMAALESTLTERGRTLVEEFETRVSAVNTGTDRLSEALNARTKTLNETLLERTREIADTLKSGSEGLNETAETVRGGLDTKIGEIAGALREGSEALATQTASMRENAIAQTKEIANTLTGGGDMISTRAETARQAIANQSQSLADELSKTGDAIGGRVEEARQAIVAQSEILAGELAKSGETIGAGANTARQALAAQTEALVGDIAKSGETIGANAEAVRQSLAAQTEALSGDLARSGDTLGSTAEAARQAIASQTQALAGDLAKSGETFGESAETARQAIAAQTEACRALRNGLAALAILACASTAHAAETISGALAKAYENNSELNSARAGLRVSNENVPIAKSGYRPRVTGTAGITYSSDTGQFDGAGLTRYTFGIEIQQSIFDGFQTRNNVQSAEAGVRAERANLRNTEQNILFDAAQAFMDVVQNRRIATLRARNLEFLREQLRTARARLEVGEGTRTDVAQAEASLATARAQLTSAQSDLATAEAIFERLTGNEPGRLKSANPLSKPLPKSIDAAYSTAFARHPAIAARDALVDSQLFSVKSAEGAFLPQVSLSAGLSGSSQNLGGGAFGDDGRTDTRAQVGVQLTVPIYQGGQAGATVRQRKEQLGQARIDGDVARDQVRSAVQSAWFQLDASRASVRANRESVAASQLALNGVIEERDVGQRTTLDVLNAQANLITAQIAMVQAERNLVVSSYALASAVGKLDARSLGLKVRIQDPEEHYNQVKDAWYGLRTPDGR